jgi:hypothetical protein
MKESKPRHRLPPRLAGAAVDSHHHPAQHKPEDRLYGTNLVHHHFSASISLQLPMGFSAELIEKQANKHSEAIGQGIDPGVLADHLELAQNATPISFFLQKKHIRFWYETVENGDLHRRGGEIADLWAQVRSNISLQTPRQTDILL